MKKGYKRFIAVFCAALLAVILAPGKAKAAPPDNTAYLAYADGSWTYQFWGDPVEGIEATTAEITGPGEYTVGLDFTKTADGKAYGISFTAPIIQGGTTTLPGYIMTVDKIEINGNPVEFTKGYTNDEDGNLRTNIYNAWVSSLPADARTSDGSLDGASAVVVDPEVFAEVQTVYVTFTLAEGTGITIVPEETAEEDYVPPTEFTAFLMYSAAENGWEIYEPIEGVNTTKILGDGTYTVTLRGADIGATGQPSTPRVLCVDIPELAKAMQHIGKNINNYNDNMEYGLPTDLEVKAEVYVDGKKVKTKSELINYGDIEGKGTFRLELYNIWGLHGGVIVEHPPVFPESILPEEEISVTFTLKGTGFNTEAAAAEEAAKAEEAAAVEETKKEEPTPTEAPAKTDEPAAETSTAAESTSSSLSTGTVIAIILICVLVVAAVVITIVVKKRKNGTA